jgi:hypothetical protein
VLVCLGSSSFSQANISQRWQGFVAKEDLRDRSKEAGKTAFFALVFFMTHFDVSGG